MERIFETVLWSMRKEKHMSGDDQKQGRWACSHQDLTENGFPDRILTSPHQSNFLCFLVEYSESTALLVSPQQLLVPPLLTETPSRSPLTWGPRRPGEAPAPPLRWGAEVAWEASSGPVVSTQ